jgi:hypothetical protein
MDNMASAVVPCTEAIIRILVRRSEAGSWDTRVGVGDKRDCRRWEASGDSEMALTKSAIRSIGEEDRGVSLEDFEAMKAIEN